MKTLGRRASEFVILMWGFVFLGLAVGWLMNLFKVAQTGIDIVNGMFIARLIGIVIPPIGGILGYF